eukprot:COSAG01_NODE_61359_length_290_cov_0.534031_1_plen_30_part_01
MGTGRPPAPAATYDAIACGATVPQIKLRPD